MIRFSAPGAYLLWLPKGRALFRKISPIRNRALILFRETVERAKQSSEVHSKKIRKLEDGPVFPRSFLFRGSAHWKEGTKSNHYGIYIISRFKSRRRFQFDKTFELSGPQYGPLN